MKNADWKRDENFNGKFAISTQSGLQVWVQYARILDLWMAKFYLNWIWLVSATEPMKWASKLSRCKMWCGWAFNLNCTERKSLNLASQLISMNILIYTVFSSQWRPTLGSGQSSRSHLKSSILWNIEVHICTRNSNLCL